MGSLQAAEMAELVPMEQAIAWHLRSNHYPPIPASMAKPCLDAIDAYWEDDIDREIQMPDGISYRGGTTVARSEDVRSWNRAAWLDAGSEDKVKIDVVSRVQRASSLIRTLDLNQKRMRSIRLS